MAMDLSKSYEYFQPEKVEARINIVGCGSVGATLAENLVRLGITNLALWDMDVVNPHNLANQIFRQQDIGRPKVEALADILFEINPEIKDDLKLSGKGWSGQQLSGYVFLCVPWIIFALMHRKELETAGAILAIPTIVCPIFIHT